MYVVGAQTRALPVSAARVVARVVGRQRRDPVRALEGARVLEVGHERRQARRRHHPRQQRPVAADALDVVEGAVVEAIAVEAIGVAPEAVVHEPAQAHDLLAHVGPVGFRAQRAPHLRPAGAPTGSAAASRPPRSCARGSAPDRRTAFRWAGAAGCPSRIPIPSTSSCRPARCGRRAATGGTRAAPETRAPAGRGHRSCGSAPTPPTPSRSGPSTTGRSARTDRRRARAQSRGR